ncbi:MAG: tol-pal system protein YbgF [Candidatus Zixiibacteriota bacterium]|nr:MAG: tol-pal system protein YbgF [candidate division Zixibacteria bacterium]
MLTGKKVFITAIVVVAVMCIGIGLSGCATKRNMDELAAEVRDVKRQNESTQTMLTRLDSVITAGADANNKLRNDVSVTVNDLQQQLDMLLENYNDLLAQIQQMNRQPSVTHVIRPSPGAQDQTPVVVTDTAGASDQPAEPAIDCDATYDESFILVRRGEYDTAIEGFRNFLTHCEQHQSAENAHYWIGECYYSLEKYVDAISEFEYLLSNYKSSVNASRALYKLARSKQELGKTGEAKETFQRLIDDYPETLEASQARERLKDLQ